MKGDLPVVLYLSVLLGVNLLYVGLIYLLKRLPWQVTFKKSLVAFLELIHPTFIVALVFLSIIWLGQFDPILVFWVALTMATAIYLVFHLIPCLFIPLVKKGLGKIRSYRVKKS